MFQKRTDFLDLFCTHSQRDGIHGGYRFSLHIRSAKFFYWGGGEYFRKNFGHLKSEVFHLGGLSMYTTYVESNDGT